MPDRHRAEIDMILDRHDEAFRAFRQASDAFDAAVGALRDTLNVIQAANHAQGDAIDALRSANQAALRMLREPDGGRA
jgi:outer membrane protein TolC